MDFGFKNVLFDCKGKRDPRASRLLLAANVYVSINLTDHFYLLLMPIVLIM